MNLIKSKMSGTPAGSGAGSGVFTLVFDGLYNRGATFARIDTSISEFGGGVFNTLVGATTTNFDFTTNFGIDNYDMSSFTLVPVFTRCIVLGTQSIPDNSINVYNLDNAALRVAVGAICTMSFTPNYSGLAAVIDGVTTDDTLIYAITNGTNSEFAVLTQ